MSLKRDIASLEAARRGLERAERNPRRPAKMQRVTLGDGIVYDLRPVDLFSTYDGPSMGEVHRYRFATGSRADGWEVRGPRTGKVFGIVTDEDDGRHGFINVREPAMLPSGSGRTAAAYAVIRERASREQIIARALGHVWIRAGGGA